MSDEANSVIDHLGGTSRVAKLLEAPVSTVHSWRTNGIPRARLAHLRLVAQAEGKPLPDDLSGATNATEQEAAPTGQSGEMSGTSQASPRYRDSRGGTEAGAGASFPAPVDGGQ